MGGYLLLNTNGRPLEFHCTLPLRPTRTQEVLYGPSLRPYLIGDLIGRAVVGKSRLKAATIITDQSDAIELASSIKIPVACTARVEGTHEVIEVDGQQLTASMGHRAQIVQILESLPATLNLSEPFERIREAFDEAKGSSRAAA